MIKRSLFISFLILSIGAGAQEKATVQEGQFTFDTDKPFTLLELDQKEEPIVTKKKKPKRKVYYGIKTKKAFTRKGFGDKMVIELFYVLKKPDVPTGFARDVYWYDFTRKELRRTSNAAFDTKKGVLAHGPYKRMSGDILIEEGIFFKDFRIENDFTYRMGNSHPIFIHLVGNFTQGNFICFIRTMMAYIINQRIAGMQGG